MYKVVIQTKHIPFITKSPILNTIAPHMEPISPQLSPKVPESSTADPVVNTNEMQSHIQNLEGQLHLFKNIGKNSTQEGMYRVKSSGLLIINWDTGIEDYVRDRIGQIQHVVQIHHHVYTTNHSKQNLMQEKQLLGTRKYMAIVFKSILIAEQVHNYVNDVYNTKQKQVKDNINGPYISIYVQNITIIQKQSKKIDEQLVEPSSPSQQWRQIPTCPACLQTLQFQITGIQVPKFSSSYSIPCVVCHVRSAEQSRCHECSEMEDNWVCMICGTVGCGRYKNADAYKHYCSYKHILSLDLKTHMIWNYQFDCFSHSIGRDGIMEQKLSWQENQHDNQQIEVQFWKYCNIVSQQLEKQRIFYNRIKDEQIQRYMGQQKILEQKIKSLESLKQQKKQNVKKKTKKNKKLQKRCTELEQQCKHQRWMNKHLQQTVKSHEKYKQQSLASTQSQNKQKPKAIEKGNYIQQASIQTEAIRRKKQELKRIEDQIQQILISLTEG